MESERLDHEATMPPHPNGERPEVHSILKLYQDKIKRDRRAGGLFGISFNRSKGRQSVRHSNAEDRVNLGEVENEAEGITTVNMLTLARRARLPLSALILSLSNNGDRRDVRVRNEEGSPRSEDHEDESLLGAQRSPTKYVDISFDEMEERKRDTAPSSLGKQSGFGLLISPATSMTSAEKVKKDAFQEWLSDTPAAGQHQKVSVAVEVPGRADFENDAFLVLDPTSVKDGNPQWVFAVPTAMPNEAAAPDSFEGRMCSQFPSEVKCVTIYCEQETVGEAASLAIVISVELSRPIWAWVVLAMAVLCSGLITPLMAELHRATDESVCVSAWWGTAGLIFSLVCFLATLLVHRFTPSEISFLCSRGGILRLCLLALTWATYAVFWTAAVHNKEENSDTTYGPTALAIAFGAMHPVGIVLYRALRRQSIFIGEAVGFGLFITGMLVLAWPQNSWVRDWEADMYASASAVGLAGFLISAKTLSSQLPSTVVMMCVSFVSFLMLIIVGAAGHDDEHISTCLGGGWREHQYYGRCFVALIFVSGLLWMSVVHALKFLHPLAVSVALCLSSLLTVFFTSYVFDDVDVVGDFGGKGVVPGAFIAVIGCAIAMYTSVLKRQVWMRLWLLVFSCIQRFFYTNFKPTKSKSQRCQINIPPLCETAFNHKPVSEGGPSPRPRDGCTLCIGDTSTDAPRLPLRLMGISSLFVCAARGG